MGGIKSIRKIRRVNRLTSSPRVFVRHTDIPIVRDRRVRPIEAGEDPLEARASKIPHATLPERIVHKKLAQLLGGEDKFVFQRTEGGGRLFIGGFVLDFLILDTLPPLVIEVLGDFWHQAVRRFADEERALTVISLGYAYAEIWEHDIYASDQLTEQILRDIIERRPDLTD